MKLLFLLFAVVNAANGVWMLTTPGIWFTELPAGVPDTGPLNEHFVRDLGVVYLVCGLGFAWCARNPERALPVHLGITLFYLGHAVTHVLDIVGGRLPLDHWWIDTPGVFLPTLVLLGMTVVLVRREREPGGVPG